MGLLRVKGVNKLLRRKRTGYCREFLEAIDLLVASWMCPDLNISDFGGFLWFDQQKASSYLNFARVGGFHMQGIKGAAIVVSYCNPLITPQMEASDSPEG